MANYRGKYERTADNMMAENQQEICINWINMSAKEAGSGGADRITKKLLDAGYRPDGSICVEKHRGAYVRGERWNGSYIRFPQETWKKTETPGAATPRESK